MPHPVNIPVSSARPSNPAPAGISPLPVMRGGPPTSGCWKESEDAAVETVTLTVTAADPFKTTGLGDTVHLECAGAPVQEKATDWLNPPLGTRESE